LKRIYLIVFTLAILLKSIVFSQEKVDSLIALINNTPNDTTKVSLLFSISEEIQFINPDSAVNITYLKNALELSQIINFKKGEAEANKRLGIFYSMRGIFNLAINYYDNSILLYKEMNMEHELADVLNRLGIVYANKGDFENAQQYYLSALTIREKLNDKRGISSSLNSLGNNYLALSDLVSARIYFERSLTLVKEIDFKFGIATVLNNLGLVYEKEALFDSALSYFNQSLDILETIGHIPSISSTINNIANMYYRKDDFEKALLFYNKSINYKNQIGDQNGIVHSNLGIAVVHQKNKQFDIAIDIANKALASSKELKYTDGIARSYDILTELYAEVGKYKEAYESMRNFAIYKEELLNEESTRNLAQFKAEYEAEKRESEIALQKAENEQSKAIIKQQTTQLYAFAIGIILVLILAGVVMQGYRQKRKANILLESQNIEITKQKALIEEKNRDIMDSINYARRIQYAILPPKNYVDDCLSDLFVFFKPRDIVSGDFYWIEKKHNRVYTSVIDCTGHGVPGAFMSIVGHNAINQAVNEIGLEKPSDILDKVNELVLKSLHQTDKTDVKDGMDMALCSYMPEQKIVEYAGANNPIYILRREQNILIENDMEITPIIENNGLYLFEIKANKQPIGAYAYRESFTNHVINVSKGDLVFMFSDGFPDQFGGSKGKKYKYKPFKDFLMALYDKPIKTYSDLLDKELFEWKGMHEQNDDICILGFKV